MVVSSWYPTSVPARFETIAASSTGKAAEYTQALTVMLPVSCRPVGLPRFTKSSLPSRLTAVPYFPTLQVAPPVSVPVRPCPEASAAVVPAPSSKA